jgi:hypothetical protein
MEYEEVKEVEDGSAANHKANEFLRVLEYLTETNRSY